MQAFRVGLSVARLAPRLVFREYATIVPRTTTSNLSPIPASRHKQKRLGRGPSSGLGGTSTRGHKGQKARSGNGKPKAGFEGGQTPISRRFPKRGFYNQNVKVWAPINLDRIQHWINQGRLTSSPETPITVHHLYKSGCIHGVSDGAKLLADGANQLTFAIHLEVSRASKKAIHAVEKLGGTVVCKYYNDLSLKDCVDDRTDRKAAAPIRKNDILWYTNSQNRGYLSPFILRDAKGMQEEKDARVAQATLRKTQAKHAFPVFKLSDMKQLPPPLKL